MTPFSFFFFFLLLLIMILLLMILWRLRSKVDMRRLPPGSMGWPYIGETLRLFSEDPNTFFSARQKKYGDIFKTHILGCPCVMVCGQEAARQVLVSQAHMFKPTYPPSKERMIGPDAIFFHQGPYHSNLRKLVQSSLTPSAIMGSVPRIEQIVLGILPFWKDRNINTLQEMKMYAFDVAMVAVFGGEEEEMDMEMTKMIRHLYDRLEKGFNSMPLDIFGTPFSQAMKARSQLNDALMKVIQQRRKLQSCKGNYSKGLLAVLLENRPKMDFQLTDSQVVDNVIGIIFAAHDTTASALTWVLKYLHDNPDILEAVTKEQEGVKRRLIEENRGLNWDDTRRMPMTSRVIQETLRGASILSFTYRESVQDVELKGYFIPKGWKVLPVFRSIHHCEDFFPQPEKFDPSRFEVPPRANTYMPFGNGIHSCPGSEIAKLEMVILLHHLTLTYRWEVEKRDEEGVEYGPFPVPKSGFPIKFTSL